MRSRDASGSLGMIKKWIKYENWILTFLALGISALLMSVFFDFYYALNDDTLMRDIMSGVYSGTPDGHNMQTLYPLGAVIALCYRLYGAFPWYGAFLILCQFGCFFAVGVRLCALVDAVYARERGSLESDGMRGGAGMRRRFIWKLLCLLGLTLFQWGAWLTHMVNVQYTITSGMLAGTAVFLFLTIPCGAVKNVSEGGPEALSVKGFLIKSLPALLFFLLAFQLRSEMALLVLPFPGLAGIFCWWGESPVFAGKNIKKYGGLFLLLLAGMGLSLGADALAYGGEWKEFRQFFDDRTTIYDFYQEVVTDDVYAADLESLGASPAMQTLLRNYNFGLQEGIDAKLLSNVAGYAQEQVGGERDWDKIFREKLLLYRYRSFHGGDAPYNILVGLAYAANTIAIVMLFCGRAGKSCSETGHENAGSRRRSDLYSASVQLFLIILVRTALWMFILMRGRDPERITHPLYLAEFCLLAGMFLRRLVCRVVPVSETAGAAPVHTDFECGNVNGSAARKLLYGTAAVLCLLSAAGMIKAVPAVRTDQARRQEINAEWAEIDKYCRDRQGAFFFEDVYSTVAFSGKLLECRDNALANYDIAGGWICKSPLYRKKLAVFGIEDAADAFLDGNAYFIMSDEEREQRGLDWLTACYVEQGIEAEIAEGGRIGENYGVYQVISISEGGADGRR